MLPFLKNIVSTFLGLINIRASSERGTRKSHGARVKKPVTLVTQSQDAFPYWVFVLPKPGNTMVTAVTLGVAVVEFVKT